MRKVDTVICRRCGKPLRAEQSRKDGIGARCARMEAFEQERQQADPYEQLLQKWNQLSLKVSTLERKLSKLIATGVKAEAIERISKAEIEAEPTQEAHLKSLIHQELASIFKNEDGSFNPDWKTKILHSYDETDEIREPPKEVSVNGD